MCGIAGYLTSHGKSELDQQVLSRMVGLLRHRGPDGQGTFSDGPVGLGHARLSIIDLAAGAQPMCNEDKSIWITFNGEIFNYLELRQELLLRGHKFCTRSDTEVILHLYEEEGPNCLHRLNGQWAFAIWDRKTQRLLLARDRLGVRPLFYTTTAGRFLFASEVKSLLCHPAVSRRIDPEGLDQIFTYWCNLGSQTMFQGISELPPGCWLTFQEGKATVHRYWLPCFSNTDGHSREDFSEELLQRLTDAVRVRLRSDVPVGCYLSGGLDSTIVAALMRKCTDAPLRMFSVGFDDVKYDETPFQLEAARSLDIDHFSMRCTTADIGCIFPEVIWHTEKPVLRTAPAPLFLLSRCVRDSGYKVVLTGEGSDELLGGYDIFKETKIRRFCAANPNSTLRPHLFGRLYPYMPEIQSHPRASLGRFLHAEPGDLQDPLFSHMPRWKLTAGIKNIFLTSEITTGNAANDIVASHLPNDYSNWNWLAKAQYLETIMLLPGYILSSQGDRVAMAHGVEGRFPFLDHRVVELAEKLPPTLKMNVLTEKYLLKWCSKGMIPNSIRRRFKQPYRAPECDSFFGTKLEYIDELLQPRRLKEDGIFRSSAVKWLLEKIRSKRPLSTKDNMAFVGIISTQLWIDQFIRNSLGRLTHAQL